MATDEVRTAATQSSIDFGDSSTDIDTPVPQPTKRAKMGPRTRASETEALYSGQTGTS